MSLMLFTVPVGLFYIFLATAVEKSLIDTVCPFACLFVCLFCLSVNWIAENFINWFWLTVVYGLGPGKNWLVVGGNFDPVMDFGLNTEIFVPIRFKIRIQSSQILINIWRIFNEMFEKAVRTLGSNF